MTSRAIRTIFQGAVLVAFLCGAGSAQATPITAGDYIMISDRAGTTGGGEFEISSVSDAWASFITFCLQKTQYIDFTSVFTIDGVATSAATEQISTGGDGTGRDPLSQQTAYLYTEFRSGTLSGYDYGTGRTASADLLQYAIWMLEGEIPMNVSNPFVILANNAVSTGAWSGLGSVRALNLSYAGGREAQDQLALLPTPEPASLVLFGSGLIGIAARVRRRFRAEKGSGQK